MKLTFPATLHVTTVKSQGGAIEIQAGFELPTGYDRALVWSPEALPPRSGVREMPEKVLFPTDVDCANGVYTESGVVLQAWEAACQDGAAFVSWALSSLDFFRDRPALSIQLLLGSLGFAYCVPQETTEASQQPRGWRLLQLSEREDDSCIVLRPRGSGCVGIIAHPEFSLTVDDSPEIVESVELIASGFWGDRDEA